LMGVYLDKGTLQIELKFEDPYKKMGSIISIFSLLILLIFVVLQMNSKKSHTIATNEL